MKILRLLAERPRGIGQLELCMAAGISLSQFSQLIEPFLRSSSFIETLSRRVIRPEGLAYLAELGKIDRPEVRTALSKAEAP